MTFSEYQALSKKTAFYPHQGNNVQYPMIGLMGEVGEAADILKRILRDKDGVVSDEDRQKIRSEIGDIVWYLAQLATEVGANFDDVVEANIEKLQTRKNNGTLVSHARNVD